MKGLVFVLDDNLMDINVAVTAIERAGYECHGFTEQAEALTWLKDNSPTLIFLDIQMPGRTGYELIPTIKALPGKSETPIIMISGKNQTDDVLNAIKLGAKDYVVKPLDPLILQEKLGNNGKQSEEFHNIELPTNQAIEVLASRGIRIVGLSEFGLKIVSSVKIGPGESFQITELPLDIFGKDRALIRCLTCEKDAKNQYVAYVTFVGMTEAQRQSIRKSCRQIWVKNRKEAV